MPDFLVIAGRLHQSTHSVTDSLELRLIVYLRITQDIRQLRKLRKGQVLFLVTCLVRKGLRFDIDKPASAKWHESNAQQPGGTNLEIGGQGTGPARGKGWASDRCLA
ncbi:MAG: hypothetical protein O2879_04790 [Proteobacteria bacterium]|nr:hypothetical protein [Pseudomonadota bacterium]MDA0914441.1 hypothetical protein [Pseudomonadota bacterium]